jgi:hypothetical protein
MSLPRHQRTKESMFRRKRADSLIKNLKLEYPELESINGSMKLGTLRDRLGVTSLHQALEALRIAGK